jgi:hypothetical protein
MMKEMIITIMKDGEVKVETSGFTGAACVDETKALKAMLGEETSRELKATYYERDGVKSHRHLPLCG